MPAPKAKITNIATLAGKYEAGKTLSELAQQAKPQAVDYRTLRAALKRHGVKIRK